MLLLTFCKKMYLYPLLFGHLRFFCHQKHPTRTTTFPYITLRPGGTFSTVPTFATTIFPTLSTAPTFPTFPPISGCPPGPPICPLPINTPPFCPCIDQRGGIYIG